MDKQTTFAFILIGVVLVFWLYMNAPDPDQQLPINSPDTTITEEILPEKIKEEEPKSTGEYTDTRKKTFGSNDSIPENVITIETDLAKIELSSKGGRFRKYYLKNYNTWYHNDLPEDADFYDKHVQLVNQKDGGDFNVIFVTKEGEYVNSGELNFTTSFNDWYKKIEGNEKFTLDFTFVDEKGHSIKKTFTFTGNNYACDADIELINMNEIISSYRYDVEWSSGINFVEQNSVDESNYSSSSAFAGDEKVEIDASSIGDKIDKDINGKVDWVGIKNKYFAIIFSPKTPYDDGGAYFKGEHVDHPSMGNREYYSASLKVPFKDSDYQKDEFEIFIGPIDYDLLESYGKQYEKIFEFGSFLGLDIFQPISEYLLLPLFKFIHNFIPNYGFVIIIFSLIIKFALYPLSKQSMKSMKKMQLLQPMMAELKAKYKDDPQRVQKETMKLYSTYGINPAGGCLPMLLQMPILFALWTLFNVAIELRGEPFIFWITNLAVPDVIYTLPFKIPLFGVDQVTGLAPLLGISMFLQQKQTMKDPSQKAMVYMMPVLFTVMFMGFPAGLNLYYLMFNLLSVAQQQWVNKFGKVEELKPVPQSERKKGGFMQRMMEAAEQQAKSQKDSQKKRR